MVDTVMTPRRPGRPRAVVGDEHADTRETILDAAAYLFATNGYAATGTREIAARVGLRQASLFHHFARKDDVLAELLDRTVTPALAAAQWLDAAGARPEVRLYLLARQDAANLCGGRHNLAVLQLLPEAKGPRFAPFWAKRADLRGRYRALISEAADRGLTVDLPLELLTDLVFGSVEATMTWSDTSSERAADRIADAVACTAVRGVLHRPPTGERLRAAAQRLLVRQG
jgi:AcrR family transcriptional regulator